LLDPGTAATFTLSNHTAGARIAVRNLKDQVSRMRMLRGENVVPLVELSRAPMKTEFGQKLRPDFKVVSWHRLGGEHGTLVEGGTPPHQLSPTTAPRLEHTEVEQPTTREELDDEIPF
jgi:hypothetical protein